MPVSSRSLSLPPDAVWPLIRGGHQVPLMVEASPCWGLRASLSSPTKAAAEATRRFRWALLSSMAFFELTSPRTVVLSAGTWRSGSKPPERSRPPELVMRPPRPQRGLPLV